MKEMKINIQNIDLSKLKTDLKKNQYKWIAISEENKVVASGDTYADALSVAQKKSFFNVVLFKVPPLNQFLAPHA